MRASESVLVVSELLCTGVQANTERHSKERNARNVLMLVIQTTGCCGFLRSFKGVRDVLAGVKQGVVDFFAVSRASVTCLLE